MLILVVFAIVTTACNRRTDFGVDGRGFPHVRVQSGHVDVGVGRPNDT